MSTTHRVRFTVDVTFTVDSKGEECLLSILKDARQGIEHIHEAFVCASIKAAAHAPTTYQVHTALGEATGHTLSNALSGIEFGANSGITMRFKGVQYEAIDAPAVPPTYVQPLVISVGNKSVH